jgi:hypothetical protein
LHESEAFICKIQGVIGRRRFGRISWENFQNNVPIYYSLKNLVLWARSEQTGYAENKCSGMMEYWNVGIMG